MIIIGPADLISQDFELLFTGKGNSMDRLVKIIHTSDGNIATCGVADTNDVVNGYRWISAIVSKIGPTGTVLWKRKFNEGVIAPSQFCAKSIAETKDSGFVVTGWARSGQNLISRAFVLRLNSNGTELWRRYFLPVNSALGTRQALCSAADILVRPNRNIVVLGVVNEMNYDTNYAQYIGVPNHTEPCTGLQSNANKKLWMFEITDSTSNLHSISLVWKSLYNPYRDTTNNQGVDLAFTFRTVSLAVDSSGVVQDDKFASLIYSDDNMNGQIDSVDGYTILANVVNTSTANVGFSLLRISNSGTVSWWNMYESTANPDGSNKISTSGAEIVDHVYSSDTCLLVTGCVRDYNNYRHLRHGRQECYTDSIPGLTFMSNILLAKLTRSGNVTWAQDYGTYDEDEGYSISQDNNGYVYLFGGKHATEQQEPGYSGILHQGFIIKTTVGNALAAINNARSVGGAYDDHFISGIHSGVEDALFAVGHSSSYNTSSGRDNDGFVVRTDPNGVTDECEDVPIAFCLNNVPLTILGLSYEKCERTVQCEGGGSRNDCISSWHCNEPLPINESCGEVQ
jgi:hypothetical protein